MVSKFVIFAATMAVATAAPFTITADNYYPNTFESPSFAYGVGGGISSNIGGIKHSDAWGTSFKFGEAEGYGAGYASNEGLTRAGGIGSAYTGGKNNVIYYPRPVQSNYYQTPTVLPSASKPGYAVSSAQNTGGSRVAFAQSQNGPNYGTAIATNSGYGANNYGNNVATAQTIGQGTSISTSQIQGGLRSSSAQAVSSGGQTGAITINAPGHQIAQSLAYGY
ncbi:hypothetical protein K1T71_002140 [Dendrolimus kikuchii]|uniref:Uncharacterized protein n=1 Tax=Dendrolimus kikuchii TaxID=765133 RepID=A0ACC1DFV8_9NEOP|nr:hypothetical protein K1T71_002140 [Dendrolimus kikuchii]